MPPSPIDDSPATAGPPAATATPIAWALLRGDAERARELATSARSAPAAVAFAAILSSRFDEAYAIAVAVDRPDLEVQAVGRLAASMGGITNELPRHDRPRHDRPNRELPSLELPSLDELVAVDAPTVWTSCLFGEAAMSLGRLDVAEATARPVWTAGRADDPHTVFAGQTLVRSLLFQGRLDEAGELSQAVEVRARAFDLTALRLVVHGSQAYVAALRDDRGELARCVDEIDALTPHARPNYFVTGALVLASYALAAAGRAGEAARMMLRGAGGPELPLVQAVDRAYGYELLVTAALGVGDVGQALDWGARADKLNSVPSGMAMAALRRIAARLAAAEGDAATSAALAREAGAIAEGQTGHLDATRAELIRGSALLHDVRSSVGAERVLLAASGQAAEMGAVALAVLARRDLRSIGLRFAGADQTPMSRRERQVADLVIAGLSNAKIAGVLGISERTVQSHVSRVLRALGLPSRATVGAALSSPATGPSVRSELTARQQEVADLVVRGYTNDGIARALRISVKTVEKHLGDVYRRLSVNSRSSLAARWTAS